MRFRSRWLTVGGVRTHHGHSSASGTPVALANGLAVSHRNLMPTAGALAGRHPVLVPDLPGFGLSGKPWHAYDVHQHAEHLAAWLDVLALPDLFSKCHHNRWPLSAPRIQEGLPSGCPRRFPTPQHRLKASAYLAKSAHHHRQ